MSTQMLQNTITRAAVLSLAGMTVLFFACDTHTIMDSDSIEEVEASIGAMTETVASPLFIVNGEIVQDISHINATEIERVRVIRGSDVTAYRLRNAMKSTSDRLSGSAYAFHAGHEQEAEGRRLIIRGADVEGQDTAVGFRMMIKGEDSESDESEGRRIIRNPDAEQSSGQTAKLRSTFRNVLDGELAEKISGHPDTSNGIVIITLRSEDGDASGLEK